jgi:Beta-propeller repeat
VVAATYDRVSLAFEPNVGQVRGADSERVKFVARQPGCTVFLMATGTTIQLRRRERGPEPDTLPHARGTSRSVNSKPDGLATVQIQLIGADSRSAMFGTDLLPGKTNYLLGKDAAQWRQNVPTYGKVAVRNVYPGIDEVFYGRKGRLEFDFIVHPGADPGAVKLAPQALQRGSQSPRPRVGISADGDLVIKTAGGDLRLARPLAYQPAAGQGATAAEDSDSEPATHKAEWVGAQFVPYGNDQFGIRVARYDRSKPLIIDPVLTYSTYLGGSGYDAASAIAVDSSGNAYVTGQTDSLDFPAAGGAQNSIGGGACGSSLDAHTCFDAFVTKLAPSGASVIYSTYLGGSGDDRGTGIGLDTTGNAYVTGITNSADFPVANAIQPNLAGGVCGSSTDPEPCFDAFVTKLDPTGSAVVYSTYLGGTGQDLAAGIAVDSAGEATIAGSTSSLDFPVSAGALQGSYGGGTLDAFIARLDSSGGTPVYSTYLGGSGEDRGLAVAVGASGDTYVSGSTTSNDFPAVNGFQAANAGGACGSATSPIPCTDAFVARIDSQGKGFVYSTYLGGTGGDTANAIAVDAYDAAYVTGSTTSPDFPTTSDSLQRTGGGNSVDVFISKVAPQGSSLEYSTYLGGIGQEAAYGIALDSARNAYITGYANDLEFPVASPVEGTGGGFNDAFVSKLNVNGSALIFSTYLGGRGDEAGEGIAVDSAGDAYVAGWTFSTDFPTTSALEPSYLGGSYDAFVARLSGLSLPVASLSKNALVFAAQGIGTNSALKRVTFTNDGDAVLNISNIAVSGEFTESDDCPAELQPQSSCTLSISSDPSDLGPQEGSVTVTDKVWGSPQIISLAGNGIPSPVAAFSPGSLNFQSQLVGTASPLQFVMLANPGSATLEISSVTEVGDFLETNDCDGSVVAGGHCTFRVAFEPKAAGTSSGYVSINDNAPGSPHVILLAGTGTGPNINLSRMSVTFPDQAVGTDGSPQTLNLASTGVIALNIASIVAHGDFSESNDCPSSLAPGAACTIEVSFSPAIRGLRIGSVAITDDAAESPQVISLSGRGVTPIADLSNSSVDFADQGVSTASSPKTVALANNGGDALTISSIASSGDFSQANNCGAQLAPGASCEIQLAFVPTTFGTRTGTLSVQDDAQSSPQTASLVGTGVTAFTLAAAPSQATVLAGTETASFTVAATSPYSYSRAIALGCDSSSTIQCAFEPPTIAPGGQSVLTVGDLSQPASNTLSFRVTGASEGQTASLPVSVMIADYSISAAPTEQTIALGSQATFSLSVVALNGFNQPVSIECSGTPAFATCQALPSSVTPSQGNPAHVIVMVTTTAPAFTDFRPVGSPREFREAFQLGVGMVLIAGVYFLICSARNRTSRRRAIVLCAMELFIVLLWAGCGGGGQSMVVHHPGTPAGSYDLQIRGSAGQLVHSTTVTLKIG